MNLSQLDSWNECYGSFTTVEPPLTATSAQPSPLFNGHVFLFRLLIHSLKSSCWKPPHNGHLSSTAVFSCPDFWSIHSNPLIENLPITTTSLQRPCFPVPTSDPFTQILFIENLSITATSAQPSPLFNGHVFLSRLLIHSLKSFLLKTSP